MRVATTVSMVNSNYATDKADRRSVSGNVHTLGGIIVGWLSKTQNSVTLSVTEAEYVSASTGGQEIVIPTMLLRECGIEVKLPGILLEDDTGATFSYQKSTSRSENKTHRCPMALVARKARRRNP
jgi:hypothetical protein